MRKGGLQGDEQGFAALVVGMVLVTVLGLMTIGFAELMKNELGQVTNRQLSSQAYYAAESGINDAVAAINDNPDYVKKTCPAVPNTDTEYKYLGNPNVGGDSNSAWTCVLIDPNPTALEYNPIGTDTPTTFVTKAINANTGVDDDVKQIDIYWQDANGGTDFQTASGLLPGAFPKAGTGDRWKGTGVLRVAVTPLPGGGVGMSRVALDNATFTTYLYPTSVGSNSSTPYVLSDIGNHGGTGEILNGGCTTTDSTRPRYCHTTITSGSTIVNTGAPVLFALRSIYNKTNVYITGTDSGGQQVRFQGAQTVIDATGRAQDVLKRLQVRVSQQSNNTIDYPSFAANGTSSICKQLFGVYPGGTVSGCGY